MYMHGCALPQVREVTAEATWRAAPLSHSECILKMLRKRGKVNPLLTAPWVKTKIFRMDWLHCSDLGVAADFLGNFFHEVVDLFPGGTKKDRCASLYQEVLAY